MPCSDSIENTDPSLFEADIKLLSEQRFALETTGDIDAHVRVKRGITSDRDRLWPGGVVPYNITEDLRKFQNFNTCCSRLQPYRNISHRILNFKIPSIFHSKHFRCTPKSCLATN